MQVGVLLIDTFDFPVAEVRHLLSDRGYELSAVIDIGPSADFAGTVTYLQANAQAIVVCGTITRLFAFLREQYKVDESQRVFLIGETAYALSERYEKSFITDTVIPLLNSRCKTFYSTAKFSTFGKSEEELREILKDQIRNRNRMVFQFFPAGHGCEVDIRYSNKMSKSTVDEMIGTVTEKLKACTYAFGTMSLAEAVVDLLKVRGKTLCLAESFTGGKIAASLVAVPGASDVLYEGIVSYNAQSKIDRLGVDETIIDHYGAVSDETAYEMAAGLLVQEHCDLAIATTGNAGPTAEREGDVGHCFISVGDIDGIHIYEYRFNGSREEVIDAGVQYALYMLYKKLKESAFETLLKQHEQAAKSENT